MNAQQLILSHLLPITAAIAVLWLAYRLLFSNSNRLKFNRFYLLTAMLFSLALPLLGLLLGQESPQMVSLKQNLFGGTMLGEITVRPEGHAVAMPEVEIAAETAPARPQYSLWQILGGIYLIGVGMMMMLFLVKLGKLVVMIVRSPKEKREDYTAVFTGREQGSFSFLRYAFFPNPDVEADIVRHERSHIAHHHSADILFVELMMILQWFNPFIYLYKKELQSLHEYQADCDVVATGTDKRNYMMLILQQCTAGDFSGMSNNFSLILTKKRIKMITRNEKAKGLWWRLLATLPVLAILMIANTRVTAQEQKSDDKPIIVELGKFEIRDDNGNPFQLMDTVIYNEDGSYVKCVTSDSDVLDLNTGEPRKKMTITTHNADGTPHGNMKLHWELDGDVAQYTADPFSITEESLETLLGALSALADAPSNDTVYQIVAQMPKFPGDETKLMEHIAKNIKYPQEARDKGIQGRVFIGFVIEKDGSVSNVKVLRGIDKECDAEAVRVISSLPKWTPGMQEGKPVRVSYQIPINFKLTDEPSKQPAKKSDESKAKMQPDKNGVYQIVEEMPSFPGGETKLMEYIAKNLTYPQEARDKGIDGRVFIGMVIEKDGSVSNVKVLRGIGGGCDEEAVRVINSMPKWKPGMMKGDPVPVSYQIPINFKLAEKQPQKK